MSNEDQVIDFLKKLSSNCDSLDDCLKFCGKYRSSENAEVVVLSTSLLGIFYEIVNYLEYFESEIEKKFGGVNTDDEWKRIRDNIIGDLSKKIKDEDTIKSNEKRLKLISSLISAWENLPKENVAILLQRFKSNS